MMVRAMRTSVQAIWVLALLAGCSGSGSGDYGGGTTSGSTGGSSDETSSGSSGSAAVGNGNCFQDSSGCECRTSSTPTVGQTSTSSCTSGDRHVGCCAVRSGSGTGYTSCFCRTAKSVGGSSIKCLPATESVATCDDLAYVPPKPTSTGCKSDSECIGGCRAGESYFCNKASGYGTCDCR
jgi:hypothetical protein